jgi:hypothetical protein
VRGLYRRTGKREQAHDHLTTATTMYREMDMRFWLAKAEEELSREAEGDGWPSGRPTATARSFREETSG